MQIYLQSTDYFDYQHPAVMAMSDALVLAHMTDVEKAVALYYGVRDDIKYNPYTFKANSKSLRASDCLNEGQSYCIPKAVLLGALARLNGIPARLGLADVKNHLSSQALVDWLRSDIFVMHGYIELYLDGQWVKATPAFDKKLCEKMDVLPLEFNGKDDSVFHEFNGEGDRHMEYMAEHGTFEDVPFDFIVRSVISAYPHLADIKLQEAKKGHSLEKDVEG